MGGAYTGTHVHVANIHVRFTQDGANTSDHARLIRVATKKDISLRYKFSPITANTHDTWFIMHHRSAYHLDIVVTRSGLSRERRAIAISMHKAYGDKVSKLGWSS